MCLFKCQVWGRKGLGSRLQGLQGEGRELQDVGWVEGFLGALNLPPNSEEGLKGGVGFGRLFRDMLL